MRFNRKISPLIETAAISENEVTPEHIYEQRRKFMKHSIGVGLGLSIAGLSFAKTKPLTDPKIALAKNTYKVDEKLTGYEEITTYNNFYEFGTQKTDPAKHAHALVTDPWSISIEGECKKTGTLTLEDILSPHDYEERIYRFRCVEAWSMVIPWVGFALADLLKRFEPNSDAKYVQFETFYDKDKPTIGQKRPTIPWPYREGLRMDEAMHPLTFMAVGIYGKPIPNQNGAPIRLVVPWKYGFKSIKSITKIRFTKKEPKTSWNMLAPSEYGFYSNVNPNVSHPRWSQSRERRIGELFKRETLAFNGYEKDVAGMYKGLDLNKYY